MELPIAFLCGLTIGVASSVPIGPIGFAIIQGVIARGRTEGLRIGLGALVVDISFSLLALRLFGVFAPEDNTHLFSWITLISIPVLSFLGINMIRNRHQEPGSGRHSRRGLLLGFTLGITNPVLFGYWLWAASYVTGAGWVAPGLTAQIIFTTGVAGGMLLWLAAWTKLLSVATVRTGQRFRATFSLLVGIGFLLFSGLLTVNYLVETLR